MPKQLPSIRYEFRNEGDATPELLIYDDIGDGFFSEGVTAKNFANDLKALGDVDSIDVRINSVGGSVIDGHGIYSQLAKHKATVNVHIDGFALSAASYIAMAGDTITIADNGLMMIHNPAGIAFGEAKDMRKTADVLDKMRDSIVAIYAKRTGKDKEELNKLMDAETWMTASEAVEAGFADKVGDAVEITNAADITGIFNVPKRFRPLFHNSPRRSQERQAQESQAMPDPITAEAFAAQNPNAIKDWKDAAAAEARSAAISETVDRAKSLAVAFKDRPQFVLDQFIAGSDVPKAKAALADILIAENAAKDATIAELQAAKPKPAGGTALNLAGNTDNASGESPEDKAETMWEANAKMGDGRRVKNVFKNVAALAAYLTTKAA